MPRNDQRESYPGLNNQSVLRLFLNYTAGWANGKAPNNHDDPFVRGLTTFSVYDRLRSQYRIDMSWGQTRLALTALVGAGILTEGKILGFPTYRLPVDSLVRINDPIDPYQAELREGLDADLSVLQPQHDELG